MSVANNGSVSGPCQREVRGAATAHESRRQWCPAKQEVTSEEDPCGQRRADRSGPARRRVREQHVEQRYVAGCALDHFDAVQQAMTALREHAAPNEENDRRESYMRQLIRQAEADGFTRVAVVCGAWHVPGLTTWASTKKGDTKRLKGLPKTPGSGGSLMRF